MKRTVRIITIVISLMFLFMAMSIPAFASSDDYNNGQLIQDEKEMQEIEETLELLFPEYYHYIRDYRIEDHLKETEKTTLYEMSKEYNGKTYSLIIYDDDSYLWLIVEDTPSMYSGTKGSDEYFHKNASVSVPNLNGYIYFSVDYYINTSGYDGFVSTYCQGYNGVSYYPWDQVYKQTEDSSGNAYFGYSYCFNNAVSTTLFYDVGLSLGANKIGAVVGTSSGGAGWFINYLLYGFVNYWI